MERLQGAIIGRRLNDTLAVMHNNRESFKGNGAVSREHMAFAIGMSMADLKNKFHWVEEPPYLIWQAPVSMCHCFSVCVVDHVCV